MTISKEKLANSVYNHLGMPKNKSVDIVESILEIMKKTLENGQHVLKSGFGKFCVKKKKEKRGRNPATAEDLKLDRRRIVVFKCSGKLRDMVSGK